MARAKAKTQETKQAWAGKKPKQKSSHRPAFPVVSPRRGVNQIRQFAKRIVEPVKVDDLAQWHNRDKPASTNLLQSASSIPSDLGLDEFVQLHGSTHYIDLVESTTDEESLDGPGIEGLAQVIKESIVNSIADSDDDGQHMPKLVILEPTIKPTRTYSRQPYSGRPSQAQDLSDTEPEWFTA